MRVCPERDALCPHGDNCPYVGDRYECKPGWDGSAVTVEGPPPMTGLSDENRKLDDLQLAREAAAREVEKGSPGSAANIRAGKWDQHNLVVFALSVLTAARSHPREGFATDAEASSALGSGNTGAGDAAEPSRGGERG